MKLEWKTKNCKITGNYVYIKKLYTKNHHSVKNIFS